MNQEPKIEASGVNYTDLDAAKRHGQEIALATTAFLPEGYSDVFWSRGESAQLVDCGDFYQAGVLEVLGTKSMVADEVEAENTRNPGKYYRAVSQCNAATSLNDLATTGAQATQFFFKIEVCEEEYLTNRVRAEGFFSGAADACKIARCAYQGGEIPALRGLVVPGQAILSSAATGIVRPKKRVIIPQIQLGDRIILVTGNGPHANGYTRIREIRESLPLGYQTPIANGITFGEAALAPTPIYSPIIQALLDVEIVPHYVVNVTGHGLRKLMRAKQPFGYVIDTLPEPQPIFKFIQAQCEFSDRKMYASYNMNVGLALIVSAGEAYQALEIAQKFRPALDAGYVIPPSSKGKFVDLEPIGEVFESEELQVR